MEGKRITFTTATPNDQGGVIPNEVIDFSRFKANPVVLCQHQWNDPPLGLMTDIKLEGGKYSGIPIFHGETKESLEYQAMYNKGFLRACSIGGEAEWKTNTAGQAVLDKNGNRQCEKFMLYEISLVSLPSNQDAVQEDVSMLTAHFYQTADLSNITSKLVTLSSQYKIPQMEIVKETPEEKEIREHKEKLAALEERQRVKLAGGNNSPGDPSASQLPPVVKTIVDGFNAFADKFLGSAKPRVAEQTQAVAKTEAELAAEKLAAGTRLDTPAPQNKPESTLKDPTQPQPTPTGLAAEEAKKKASDAQDKAEKAKEQAEKNDATEEDKAAYKMACQAADDAMKACESAQSAHLATLSADEKEKLTLAANGGKPIPVKIRTMEELRAGAVKLAPKPDPSASAKVIGMRGTSFSKLSSPKNEEGQKILGRVMTCDGGTKDLADYQVVLESIMTDGKYSAIAEKLRVIPNISEGQFSAYKGDPSGRNRAGISLQDIRKELMSGTVEIMGRDNQRRNITALTSTDNALASPALNTIEWLPLAIFNLFPTTSWKNDIPMFGAQMTSENTGIIWANIAADPTIYKGTNPSPAADYTYTDTAVALSLTPYWLQPMLWTPLTMHQLRYDQMSTGWAQAFAKWGAIMDDELIYTLASTVPAGSIISTVGQPANPSFAIAGANDPNSFYYNPAFVGQLATPAYNDITRIEQIFNKQNFQLEREKSVLVIDPTMEAFISTDPDTKSLLTRWVQSDATDLLKIKHTGLNNRSRVAIYDPATGLVKDPSGVIPATAVSAGVGMLPSQVGMGLGMLDVFMVQNPSSYGYRMSADIRIGIVPLRANFNGVILYTYGTPNV